jgi:hypothetical protein
VEEAEGVLPFVEGEGSSLALAPVVEVLEMVSTVWEPFWIPERSRSRRGLGRGRTRHGGVSLTAGRWR